METMVQNEAHVASRGCKIDHAKGVIIGYVKGNQVQSWDGRHIFGSIKVVSSWPIVAAMSDHMYSYRAVVDGYVYHGRGLGDGMIVKLKRTRLDD